MLVTRLLSAIAAMCVTTLVVAQGPPLMPGPGDRIPDVTIYDDQGDEFQLRRLDGEATVIVFGCLT